MSQHPRRPRLRSCLLALVLLVLAPAALGSGSRPVSSEPAETAVANALGPSHEAALVVRVVKDARASTALRPLREERRARTLVGLLLLLLGGLALLLALWPRSRPLPRNLIGRSPHPRLLPAPSGPRAPPVPALP